VRVNDPIKILGIAGSLRKASYNRAALRARGQALLSEQSLRHAPPHVRSRRLFR
jgi:NAD(P)H-dependent FMN reductase